MFKICRKKLYLIFSLLTLLVIVSCVPVVTQTSAICTANQTFNSTTRKCENIVGDTRYVPVATLSSDTLIQETSKLVNLTYTDKNGDAAISCKVTSVTPQIESYSPILFDGRLFAAIDSLYDASLALTTLLTATNPSYVANGKTSATAAKILVEGYVPQLVPYRAIIKNSVVRQSITDNLNNFKSKVDSILSSSVYFVNTASSFPSEVAAINLVQTRLAELTSMITFMDNHCYCAGGYCSTQIVSKMRQNGAAAFIYSITDKDGESAYKSVTISIPAISFASTPQYAPSIKGISTPFIFNESATSTKGPLSIQLPYLFGDYNLGLVYTYHVNTNSSLGSVPRVGATVSCNALTGACDYTPPDGDLNSCPVSTPEWQWNLAAEPVVAASGKNYYNTTTGKCRISNGAAWSDAAIAAVASGSTTPVTGGTINFTAVGIGSSGNNIQINFYDIHQNNAYVDSKSSPSENFALVDGSVNEGYVRVIGTTINVFINPTITTLQQLSDLINADVKAQALVVTAPAGGTSNTILNAPLNGVPNAVTMSGGIDDFDKFSYYVSNGYTDSSPIDVVVHITPVDDAPYAFGGGILATTPAVILEDASAFTVDLTQTYRDVDSAPTACRLVAPFDANYSIQVPASACTCDTTLNTCQLNGILANTFYNGTLTFAYQILSGTGSNWSPIITKSISVIAVNHFPFIYQTTFTKTGSATTPPQNGYLGSLTTIMPPVPGITGAVSSGVSRITSDLSPLTMLESISTAEQTATLKLFATAGGNGTEESQTKTFSIVSITPSDPTLDIGAVLVGDTITFSPTLNKSGSADILIQVKDNGGYTNGGSDTSRQQLTLTIQPVNDYPYFTTSSCATSTHTCKNLAGTVINCVGADSPTNLSVTATVSDTLYWDAHNTRCYKSTVTGNTTTWLDQPMDPYQVETNEGDSTLVPFTIDEDIANTTEGTKKGIYIVSMVSDNLSLLPTGSITAFYDVNDNGIMETTPTTEARVAGDMLEVSATDESSLHKLYLKLSPATGVAGNANVTLTIRDDFAGANKITIKKFSYIVHAIAARHGGWSNITATGIKTDKFNNPVSVKTDSSGAITVASDIRCNYNTTLDLHACTNANGVAQSCTGTSSPNGSIIPTSANVIFWDSANKKCFRALNPPDKYSWIEMNSICPVTRLNSTGCPISDPAWKVATAPTAAAANQYYYNTTDKKCYKSSAAGTASWTALTELENWIVTNETTPLYSAAPTATATGQYYYDSTSTPGTCYMSDINKAWTITYVPAKVTLSWNPFNLSGTGSDANVQIAGWNIYRRETTQEYNFSTGFLTDASSTTKMTIANSSTRSFTDNTAIAGKVYYYTVRPVDTLHFIATATPEVFSEVRVIAPPVNYTFAHRWMINQEICNGMNMTTTTTNKVDPTNNYRCPYIGPGESTRFPGYYDYGQDLLVDISEAGCPYSTTACSGSACVGIISSSPYNPSVIASASAVAGSIYYNRANGSCWLSTGLGAWTAYAGTTPNNYKLNSALNPPLTNILNVDAASACSGRTAPTVSGIDVVPNTPSLPNASLPEKKDYMAYSSPPIGMLDPQISELEQGYSLDIQSRCNGSSASGVSAGYTDSQVPSSTYMYSIAGTATPITTTPVTPPIRSVITGSVPVGALFTSTESCVSRFGVQDIYGNVAQWVKDSMTCQGSTAAYTSYTCTAADITTEMGSYVFGTSVASAGGTASLKYGFDNVIGPFNDANGSGHPNTDGGSGNDAYLTNWDYSDRLYGAGNFSFPLGLPIHTDILNVTTNISAWSTTNGLTPTLLDIGVGITAAQLHGDGIIVNAAAVDAVGGKTGNLAVGGSYLSGARAGRFTMELIPTTISNRNDVGFRCIIPVAKAKYLTDTKHTYGY